MMDTLNKVPDRAVDPELSRVRWPWFDAAVAVGFVASYFVARGLLESQGLPSGVRVAAALLPVPVFALMLWRIVRGVRAMDELQRRIQLEALAVAFPLVLIILLTLGLLEMAIPLNRDDWSYRHVWAMVPVLYFAGLAWSARRYQ